MSILQAPAPTLSQTGGIPFAFTLLVAALCVWDIVSMKSVMCFDYDVSKKKILGITFK